MRDLLLAASGGALLKGLWVGDALVSKRDLGKAPFAVREVEKLSKFVHDPCLVIQGQPVSRHTVIKYITNKLGGAHHDEKRARREDQVYVLLDWAVKTLQLAGQKVPYFAFLATAQALVWSDDIRTFVERAIGRGLKVPKPTWPEEPKG